ncbi:WG repeat-containing protein [Chryseobacterium sp.]|uniref:WG repeat-containing protein n=1 Tax=Chryseobacterium sp. TaxID=1871047 RepID=UPI0011C9F853|nr:WG repeat-containing protein [Chryseobacterium sp.]TXF76146.1 WG repeat-containing protein [Chryseobacterium sp.]
MKNVLIFIFLSFTLLFSAQKATVRKTAAVKKPVQKTTAPKTNPDLAKINDSIPALIPQKIEGKFGFVNQKGKMVIKPEYSNVGFFAEDCNLLNSPNEKVQKFGSKKYASVRLNGTDFRIDENGKRVYQFKDSDLGKCKPEFKAQLFHAFVLGNYYGIIEDSKFVNAADYRQYQIYPQYDYLHILEGDDLKNPMIIASRDNRFGIIDVNNRVIVPFIYSDIKRNFAWKLARLFEVTQDGKNYYFIDLQNKGY